MKKDYSKSIAIILLLSPFAGLLAADPTTAPKPAGPRITVSVDPRVELMSIIFRLAGNEEYNRGKLSSYIQDIDTHFGQFRNHPVVELAKKLKATRSVSYDAVMSMAVHVTDAFSLQEKVPFSPQPESLDARWTPETAREFLALARKFVVETKFKDFIDQHQPLYQLATQRMQDVLDKYGHIEWFDSFFGGRKDADFRVVVGLVNGGSNYGVHIRPSRESEELYSIIGVWQTDDSGQPVIPAQDVIATVVHEFTHSYTNALVDRFADQLQPAGEKMYGFVATQMQNQAYGGWKTLMYESLNRACGLRYIRATDGPVAMQEAIERETQRSFYWVGELANLLGEYDAEPRKYRDLAQFFPSIIDFFNDYAKNIDTNLAAVKEKREKQMQEWREKGPKIVSIVPANGAEDVDPNLKKIVVTFDRPMRDKGWSVVTLSSMGQYPKHAGPVGFDAAHKVFTMPVELLPEKQYAFGLNSEQFCNFQSEEGIPLAPVVVRFKTRK